MEPIHLPGQLIHLRDWRLDDLQPFESWQQPGQRWQELDAPYYKTHSPEALSDLVGRIRTRIETGNIANPRQNLIITESGSDRLIGMVSRYWISEETHWLAAGIVIYDPALWGRGYGREALGLWTEYLFEALPALARLDLQTWSGNAGMMRLAEKLGFQLEGRFRKARIVGGAYYDALGYGVLRETWREYYPDGFGQP